MRDQLQGDHIQKQVMLELHTKSSGTVQATSSLPLISYDERMKGGQRVRASVQELKRERRFFETIEA